MKPIKWKTVLPVLGVVLVLALAFWYGGDSPDSQGLPDQTAAAQPAAPFALPRGRCSRNRLSPTAAPSPTNSA